MTNRPTSAGPENLSHTPPSIPTLAAASQDSLFSFHPIHAQFAHLQCHVIYFHCSSMYDTTSPSFSRFQTASTISFHLQCEYTLLLDSSPLPKNFVDILLIKMLDCSETARQSKHCGCTALCSCGAFSQWKLSKATPTKSTHCHFNFHTYHLTGSALLHIAVTYTVLLYLSNYEIW